MLGVLAVLAQVGAQHQVELAECPFGRPQAFGSTAAILGHPLRSLVAAARVVAEAGETLRPGDIVLAGGATAASALAPGIHVSLEIEALGRCGFNVAAEA